LHSPVFSCLQSFSVLCVFILFLQLWQIILFTYLMNYCVCLTVIWTVLFGPFFLSGLHFWYLEFWSFQQCSDFCASLSQCSIFVAKWRCVHLVNIITVIVVVTRKLSIKLCFGKLETCHNNFIATFAVSNKTDLSFVTKASFVCFMARFCAFLSVVLCWLTLAL